MKKILENMLLNKSIVYGDEKFIGNELFSPYKGLILKESKNINEVKKSLFLGNCVFLNIKNVLTYFNQEEQNEKEIFDKISYFEKEIKNGEKHLALIEVFLEESRKENIEIIKNFAFVLFDKEKEIFTDVLHFFSQEKIEFFNVLKLMADFKIKEKHLDYHLENEEKFEKWLKFNGLSKNTEKSLFEQKFSKNINLNLIDFLFKNLFSSFIYMTKLEIKEDLKNNKAFFHYHYLDLIKEVKTQYILKQRQTGFLILDVNVLAYHF